jgi:hypothetical protein
MLQRWSGALVMGLRLNDGEAFALEELATTVLLVWLRWLGNDVGSRSIPIEGKRRCLNHAGMTRTARVTNHVSCCHFIHLLPA